MQSLQVAWPPQLDLIFTLFLLRQSSMDSFSSNSYSLSKYALKIVLKVFILDDFNDEGEGNIFLGCSFTFGLGLHLEDTWSYKVNKEIGGKFWNLSLPGCGMDESFRYLYEFKDYLKIKNIFHLAPPFQKTRYEFIVDDEPLRLNLADGSMIERQHSDILIDSKYQLLHFQKNMA